ncbi:hypothetical protein [Streptomyces sp. AP-93]|uniref:hypothetical protein n=1 Tax=Streptomyces sp. AP-93 TaxID=2929048 RepID=UPI001FAED60B|nr:hypothetical protein [Streptomyces sp. AP-93]MCJ0868869.1 hypothetical protein [Streptomyces sp. AP-93]
MLIPSARAADCDACGGPRAKWVASLAMALCTVCEQAGTRHPEREPVLVGEVLAGAADALARAGRAAAPARPYSAVLLALWRSKAQRGE